MVAQSQGHAPPWAFTAFLKWRPHGDSNPGRIRERDVS